MGGWGWDSVRVFGGVGGWMGVGLCQSVWGGAPHMCACTCACMHTCACAYMYKHDNFMQMAAPIGKSWGIPLWHHHSCPCTCVCMCMCAHVCGTLPNTMTECHSHPPTPIPPRGVDAWNQSKVNKNLTNQDISILFKDLVCERLSVMHKQVSGWTVNFCPNSPESLFLEFQTRKPPQWKTSDLSWPKFTSECPPYENLQIWGDQSLLRNTPHIKNFRFEMTKIYSGIPHPNEELQIWDDQNLLWNIPPGLGIREIVFGD